MRKVYIVALVLIATYCAPVLGNTDPQRFSIHKPSFLMLSKPLADRDEAGLQVRFSAKYALLECDLKDRLNNVVSKGICRAINEWEQLKRFGTARVFLSYTTDFDFYLFSDGKGVLGRKSRPVRNRMTSPGLHVSWTDRVSDEKIGKWDYDGFTFSLIHHSNGQDIEPDTFFENTPRDIELTAFISDLQQRNPAWSDGVSRGWNYFEFEWQVSTSLFDNNTNIVQASCDSYFRCIRATAGLRLPFGKTADNPIWWQPGNDKDYVKLNRLALTLHTDWEFRWRAIEKAGLSLTTHCGEDGCSGLKGIVRFDTKFGDTTLPWMLYFHRGGNEHLYNYHEKADMVGAGLVFNY